MDRETVRGWREKQSEDADRDIERMERAGERGRGQGMEACL